MAQERFLSAYSSRPTGYVAKYLPEAFQNGWDNEVIRHGAIDHFIRKLN